MSASESRLPNTHCSILGLVQNADQYPTVSVRFTPAERVVFANSHLNSFQPMTLVVPSGWKQVAVYTDLDLVARKVLQVCIVCNIQDRHELTF
jgi:hypothetical protein